MSETTYVDPRDAVDSGFAMPDEAPAGSLPAVSGGFAPPSPHRERSAPVSAYSAPGMGGASRPLAPPRDWTKIMSNLKMQAAMMGERWIYAFPVKSQGRTTEVKGLSIKGAAAVYTAYGNCDVDVRAVDEGDSWTFYARFIDLESGVLTTRPYTQPKSQETFKIDASKGAAKARQAQERQMQMAYAIGVSKAKRNVVVEALGSLCEVAFDEAENALVGKVGKDLAGYRGKVLQRLHDIGVDPKRVERVHAGKIEGMTARAISMVIKEIQSVNDGLMNAEDLWPPLEPAKTQATAGAPKNMDAFAGASAQQKAKPEPEQEAAAEAIDTETGEILDADPEQEAMAGDGQPAAEGQADAPAEAEPDIYQPETWPAPPGHVKTAMEDVKNGWPRIIQWLKVEALPKCPAGQRQHLADFYADAIAVARKQSATQRKMVDGILEVHGVTVPAENG